MAHGKTLELRKIPRPAVRSAVRKHKEGVTAPWYQVGFVGRIEDWQQRAA